LCKELIRFPVGVPRRVVEHNLAGVIMQKGPENGIYSSCQLHDSIARPPPHYSLEKPL
jgi:hypothetical protein